MKQDINEKIFDLLETTGLNWTVQKEPLISQVDGSPATGVYGIFKTKDRKLLGSCGEVYQPMQNATLAEAIIIASENVGLKTTRGGILNDGAKVYLQAELPSKFIGKSAIRRWLTALGSHDSSTASGFGSSNTVVICQNTFFRAYRELQKIRHTMSADDRIKTMAKDMNIALLNDEQLMKTFEIFADTKLEESLVEKVIRKIFNVDPDQKASEISTRKRNQLLAFDKAVTTELELEGNTVWGLFNGITRYTNYVSAPKDEGKKMDYLMTGGGYELSNKTFDLLAAELGIEELELVER